MGQMTCLPHVVALAVSGIREGWAVSWPHDVCVREDGKVVCKVSARAGYDEGMFCRVEILGLEEAAWDEARSAIDERVDLWEKDLAGHARLAPLTFVLADYADALADLGSRVQVCYPNGKRAAEGTFAGIDVWGRATVRTDDGRELEFGPERYSIGSSGL